jgi:hypothetical protein
MENLAGFVRTFELKLVLRIGIFGSSLGPSEFKWGTMYTVMP